MSHIRTRNGSERPNYAIDQTGLDIPENDNLDDDYKDEEKETKYEEDNTVEDDNDEDEDDDEEYGTKEKGNREIQHSNTPRVTTGRRGRPPKRKYKNTDEDGNQATDASETERSRSNSVSEGYPATKRYHFPYPVDDEGNPVAVVGDEYDLPEDTEGETKINKDGDLLGGRKFLVRSFTLSDRGNKKYMLSTEPARAVGFRDSYLFFQYHPNLYKFIISQEQKNSLIDRGVLPYSYRSRQIALVTAKSVFREFGSKIIQNGRNITDDYYATKLREEGKVVEGSLSREPSKKNLTKPSNEGSEYYSSNGINPAKNTVEFFAERNQSHRHNADSTLVANNNQINATNWLYQHAAASSRFNSDMYYDRVRVLLIESQGIRDPYTNVLHIPSNTQPSKVLGYYKVKDGKPIPDDASIKYETLIRDQDLTRARTGLSEIPREIYEDLLDESLIHEIEQQRQFESSS
ncbi:similar to Saccharomyces cerevisiae YMR091C NPL6 Component of the RSC chromatin remodeling complex [Maudiozyma saulgeensis]|uniref:Similar to Saccharomyces cerevisiae YMR091C NPL6 Component of the RSC chromatin remodeling complex n=1 Tax=Maudiozyma saulgeensis TaxID=1789683 RepID=A0A1X7R4K7_9SACH|nr:similar to Saccharomyces cerevisiae YMR091C NPL6 Component of the RSC chromatin remodeling complex [Kazachstania saulgeensis]